MCLYGETLMLLVFYVYRLFCGGQERTFIQELFPSFSAQLLAQNFRPRRIAVDVSFIHILEDVLHLIVSALLVGFLVFILILFIG